MSRVFLWDIPFDPIRPEEVGQRVQALINDGRQHVITTPNPEILLESLENPELKSFLQSSDLSIADGVGVLWATTLQSKMKNAESKVSIDTGGHVLHFFLTSLYVLFAPKKVRSVLPERVTGVDSVLDICQVAAQQGNSVFLLGGGEGVAEKTAKVLMEKFPTLQIAGVYGGRPFTEDDDVMVSMINTSGAGVLFVAFGCPKQERWITENLSQLPSIKIAMGVGGSFDFISGTIKRAPRWMKRLGIEWLYRLFQEPRRRLPRIWRAVVVFPWRVWYRVWESPSGRGSRWLEPFDPL